MIVIAWDTRGGCDERDIVWWTGAAWTDALGHAYVYDDRTEAGEDLKLAQKNLPGEARGHVEIQELV